MWYYLYSISCEHKEKIVKKFAFTLSEALVTLAILGVLAAILIPVLDNIRPDKDKLTYKKALYSLQKALSSAMDSDVFPNTANSAAYWKDERIEPEAFCEAVAESLNVAGDVNCKIPSGSSSFVNPNFTTNDGIRFWGLEGKFTSDDRTIYADRALSQNEINTLETKRGRSADDLGLKIRVGYDGRVDTPDTDEFEFENGLIEMSLQATEGNLQ